MRDETYLDLSPAHRDQYDRIAAAGGIRGAADDDGDEGSLGDLIDLDAPLDDAGGDAPAGGGDDGEMMSYKKADIERMRRESANYRGELRRLQQERSDFIEWLADGYQRDPDAMHRVLAQQFGVQVADAVTDGLDDVDGPITRDDVRDELAAVLDEREQRQQFERETETGRSSIRELAKSLGFNPDADLRTAEGRRYRQLLNVAVDEFAEDEFGHRRSPDEMVTMAAQALIDEITEHDKATRKAYLASKDGGVVPVMDGDESGTEKVPTTREESRAALLASLG